MAERIYYRGTKHEAKVAIRRIGAILSGREPDTLHIKRGVALSVGFACLSDVKNNFAIKADGGTGEDGVRWPPLSAAYLAYGRRFGTGEQSRLKKAAGLGRQHGHGIGQNTGLLTAAEKKRWQKIFAQKLQRFLLSMDPGEAKAKAAAIAWTILKREGAQTKINVFGGRQVEMLRDTGRMFNSLSPGVLSDIGPNATYTKPTGNGGEDQIFDVMDHGVIVGTNVEYAASHQHGDAARGIPARPFLPTPGQIPGVWWNRWAAVANQAVLAGVRLLLVKS